MPISYLNYIENRYIDPGSWYSDTGMHTGEADQGNTLRSFVSSVTLRSLTLPGREPPIRSPDRGAPASSGRHAAGFALCFLLALTVFIAMSSTGEIPSVPFLLPILVLVVLGYLAVAGKIYRYIV